MFKTKRSVIKKEYEQVNANPIMKYFIKTIVMVIDLFVMFLIVWNMFNLCLSKGSWINIVQGSSMYPTMKSGQIVFSDTEAVIERGAIITAYMPRYAVEKDPDYDGMIVIKRVVGVPGDSVSVEPNGVYINGEFYDESYLSDYAKEMTYINGGCNSVVLQPGEYYIMGDNRDVSYDSREFGIVRAEEILFKQSFTPTRSFYLKLALIVLILILDVFLYMLIEFVLNECAYWLLFGRKKKDDNNDKDTFNTTSETVILKGEKTNKWQL